MIIIEYVKMEDQLADIHTDALGRLKFLKLCNKIRVKKAWDEKRIKEEYVENDSSLFGAGDIAVVRGEHHLATLRTASATEMVALYHSTIVTIDTVTTEMCAMCVPLRTQTSNFHVR